MVRLLIIDDDIAVCDFLKSFFYQIGYKVFIANDGKQALAIVKGEQPDIILLDVKLPDLSGLEVLRKIKRINKHSRVIMMSAVNEEVVIQLAEKYGSVSYITKPFSLEQLEREVSLKA